MTEVQFWKPGEKRPRGEDKSASKSSGGRDNKRNKGSRGKKGRRGGAEHRGSNRRDGDGNLKEKSGKKQRGKRSGKKEPADGVGTGPPPPPVAPKAVSSSLLAMKFMQRTVKADKAQTQDKKPDRDFSLSYAKRLKTNKRNRDQLVCREDEQDPALVLVGRRSFGGFNPVAEAAYTACVREIGAGQELWHSGPTTEEEDGATSDVEMAETLWKNMRRGDARR